MDNYITFNKACDLLGIKTEILLKQLQTFKEFMDGTDMWDTLPDGARDNFMETLDAAVNNLPITESFFELMTGLSDAPILRANDLEAETFSRKFDDSTVEGLDAYSPIVASLVKLAVLISEGACNDKVDACEENSGPASLPIVVFYITKTTPGDNDGELDLSEHRMHVIQFDNEIEEGRIETEFNELLGEAFTAFGPPAVLAMMSDTLVREFDSAEEAFAKADELHNLETIYMTDSNSRVKRAISSVVVGKNTDIVTAYAPYTYNDHGIAEFSDAGYAVNSLTELQMDPSDRGTIAKIFDSFLRLGSN